MIEVQWSIKPLKTSIILKQRGGAIPRTDRMITETSVESNRHFKFITAPVIEPVTLDEVKFFARIDGTFEDTLLESLLESVRQSAEEYTNRAFISQTWRIVFDVWPGVEVELPRAPLVSVSDVYTLDEDDSVTEYDSDKYYVITDSEPGRLIIKNGETLPDNTDRYYGGYRVDYICGFGSNRSDVPSPVRDAIKLWVTFAYEQRNITPDPPPEAKQILDSWRIVYK